MQMSSLEEFNGFLFAIKREKTTSGVRRDGEREREEDFSSLFLQLLCRRLRVFNIYLLYLSESV